MTKPQQFKLCRTCHERVPMAEWPDHKQMHDDQIDMFPDMPKVEVQRKRRPRKQQETDPYRR